MGNVHSNSCLEGVSKSLIFPFFKFPIVCILYSRNGPDRTTNGTKLEIGQNIFKGLRKSKLGYLILIKWVLQSMVFYNKQKPKVIQYGKYKDFSNEAPKS